MREPAALSALCPMVCPGMAAPWASLHLVALRAILSAEVLDVWDFLLSAGISVAVVAVVLWLDHRFGYEAWLRAYEKAQRADVEYRRAHPDCTIEEAHANRDRVRRRFGR